MKFQKRGFPFPAFALAVASMFASIAQAAPSQEDVFRSISDNVGQSTDMRKVFGFMIGAAGLVLLLSVFNRWRQRETAPKALNHQGKLLKELSTAMGLKPAEMKQLKALAEAQKVQSPMTLVLCPSILARAVKEGGASVDRQLVLQIARKMN